MLPRCVIGGVVSLFLRVSDISIGGGSDGDAAVSGGERMIALSSLASRGDDVDVGVCVLSRTSNNPGRCDRMVSRNGVGNSVDCSMGMSDCTTLRDASDLNACSIDLTVRARNMASDSTAWICWMRKSHSDAVMSTYRGNECCISRIAGSTCMMLSTP